MRTGAPGYGHLSGGGTSTAATGIEAACLPVADGIVRIVVGKIRAGRDPRAEEDVTLTTLSVVPCLTSASTSRFAPASARTMRKSHARW